MEFKKLMSIIEGGGYDSKDQVPKKDTDDEVKNIRPRSKGEEDFVKVHKIDVKNEKEFEVHDPKKNPVKGEDAGHASHDPKKVSDKHSEMTYKKFKNMGGYGKSSYRAADKKEGDKTTPKVADGVNKVLPAVGQDPTGEAPDITIKEARKKNLPPQLKVDARKLATKGIGSHPVGSLKVGQDIDFYDSIGDKKYGIVTKITTTGYYVKDAHNKQIIHQTWPKGDLWTEENEQIDEAVNALKAMKEFDKLHKKMEAGKLSPAEKKRHDELKKELEKE